MDPLLALDAFIKEHEQKEMRHNQRIESIAEKLEQMKLEINRLQVQKRLEETVWQKEKDDFNAYMDRMKNMIPSSASTPTNIRHPHAPPAPPHSSTLHSQVPPVPPSTAVSRPRRNVKRKRNELSESDDSDEEDLSEAARKKRANIELFMRSGRPMLTDTNIIDYLKQLGWSRQETQDNTGLGKDLVLQIRRGDLKGTQDPTRQALTGAINHHMEVSPRPADDEQSGSSNAPNFYCDCV